MYIEGALVARGYLNNPALTDEKFVTRDISGRSTRLYKTGDLVRIQADGHYLNTWEGGGGGNGHDQVKDHALRNRVELKEIEAVITASGMVRQCLVLAKENKQGFKYLVAYCQPGGTFDKQQLIQFVRDRLPAFMMPGAWMPIDHWPLTTNNKTDRLALPEPEIEASEEPGSVIPADNDMAGVLADIWRKLLGVRRVDIHDNFFELGGDSLQLLQLSFTIYDRLAASEISSHGLSLGLRPLTDWRPGLREKTKETGRPEKAGEQSPGMEETTIAQRNLYIQNRLHPLDAFPNSSLTYEISGVLNLTLFSQACRRVIAENDSLRTGYHLSKGRLFTADHQQEVNFEVEEIRCLSEDIDKEIAQTVRSFDFGTAPLFRALVLELMDGRRYLHLYMPHINSDGESMKVIIDSLEAIYNGTATTRKRLQFSDYQVTTQAYLGSAQYREDEAFWQDQMTAPIPPLHFGFTREQQAPASRVLSGSFAVADFPEGLVDSLRNMSAGKPITIFQTLLVSFSLLLHKITGERISPFCCPCTEGQRPVLVT